VTATVLALAFIARSTSAGPIDFEIVDFTTDSKGDLVAKGRKQQLLSDVVVKVIECCEPPTFTKSVLLHDGFTLCLSFERRPHIAGFGMWIATEPEAFRWEWFARGPRGLLESLRHWFIGGPNDIFEKIQEGGRVRVRTVDSAGSEDIAEIEFLTDVSLRLVNPESGRLIYRVNIANGSRFTVLP